MHCLFGLDVVKSYALFSALCGVIFVFTLFLLSEIIYSERAPRKWFVFFIILTMGSIELFFGYVENYSLLFVGILAYLVTCISFLKEKTSLKWPVFILSLLCSLHLSAFTLLPSLIYLSLIQQKVQTQKSLRKVFEALIVFVGPLLVLNALLSLWGWRPGGHLPKPIFVPLFKAIKEVPEYTFFSLAHWLDIINEHLLISPVGPILILFTIFSLIRNRLREDKISNFLVLGSVFPLVFNFTLDPKLGAGRDWDLFAFSAIGYTLLGGYLLIKKIKDEQTFKYIGLVLVTISLLSSAPWVLLNSDTDKSIERFRYLLKLDPGRNIAGPDGYELLATYYRETKILDNEIEALEEGIMVNPRNWTHHYNLGIAYHKKELFDSAIIEYQRAIQLKPGASYIHSDLGTVYGAKGMYQEAIREFSQAITLNPKDLPACYNLAVAYALTERYDNAITQFKLVIKMNPDNASAHYNLGLAYDTKGLHLEAIEELQKAIQLDSNEATFYYALGNVYEALGQTDAAISEYEKAIRLSPNYPEAHNNLGVAYSRLGRLEEAITEFKEALKINPNFAEAYRTHKNLGDIYYQQGLRSLAISHYQEALRLRPDLIEVRQRLKALQKMKAKERLKR